MFIQGKQPTDFCGYECWAEICFLCIIPYFYLLVGSNVYIQGMLMYLITCNVLTMILLKNSSYIFLEIKCKTHLMNSVRNDAHCQNCQTILALVPRT